MQFLTQTTLSVALLLLWNLAASQGASPGSREFLGHIEHSDDDISDESNNRDNIPAHSLPSTSESWNEGPGEHSDKLAKHHINLGMSGFISPLDMLPEEPSRPVQSPHLYSSSPLHGRGRDLLRTEGFVGLGHSNPDNVNAEGSEDGQLYYDSQQQQYQRDEEDNDSSLLGAHLRSAFSLPSVRQNGVQDRFLFPKRFTNPHSRSSIIIPSSAFRTAKRSPGCLRKCMAQGYLHPSQCHSLCKK